MVNILALVFGRDDTTGSSSVQSWVVLTTLLLLTKFGLGSFGPWFFSSRRFVAPAVRLLNILKHYSVTYTLGLMSSSSTFGHATVNDFFQVWAVLIVTMDESVQMGRPYRIQLMSPVELLACLWSATQLGVRTRPHLAVPLWLIWGMHTLRITWHYFTYLRANEKSLSDIKLVSDYMFTSHHTDDDDDASPTTMKGYRYIVTGEKGGMMNAEPPSFTLHMPEPEGHNNNAAELLTLDKVWEKVQDSRFRDVCLSFALYKLQCLRFYNFPIAKATPQSRRLVSEAILEEGPTGSYERALRITEVELSFLHDFFYSRHSALFAYGFPYMKLLEALLITAKRVARITHGVLFTRCIIGIIVCREIVEVGVYVLSQWTKVWIVCCYVKLELENRQGRIGTLHRLVVEKLGRIMFSVVTRGRWDKRIRQYNLLMSARTRLARPLIITKVELRSEVKNAVFTRLDDLIMDVLPKGMSKRDRAVQDTQQAPSLGCTSERDFSGVQETRDTQGNDDRPSEASSRDPSAEAAAEGGDQCPPAQQSDAVNNVQLTSYFKNAFAPLPSGFAGDPADKLEGETHKILVWHIATSLCQMKLLEQAGRRDADLYTLPEQFGGDLAAVSKHYVAAVSLSNYCAYLVTQRLVPDNGLVVNKVFEAVRCEVAGAVFRSPRMTWIHNWFAPPASRPVSSILGMGVQLSETLMSTYERPEQLWEGLATFWAGFLLHLSASTRVAKHRIHLEGRGEFTTHLWVLLSHAGFLGRTSHGQQVLDPVDLRDG
ncbi:unnamed protein product [Urochloa decumbens]|uniref:DUF4220 domain-containing protein n=1 Tax=Urochloa decumbens TaxID=240449 RepID=A0ABC9B5F1_9POAL